MTEPRFKEEFFFAWEGADHPEGPWGHLRLLELRGEEYLSRPFYFEVELFHDGQGGEVAVRDLVGSKAALKWHTRSDPTYRILHAVIVSAEELDEVGTQAAAGRYRVTLMPPFWRAAMMRKSIIYLHKTLRETIEQVLERSSLGAGLQKFAGGRPLSVGDTFDTYEAPTLTYTWAVRDAARLDDATVRPYCVQYDESDVDFVSRLLEEEGIAYHFEFGDAECLLVMSDFDAGRQEAVKPFGAGVVGREVFQWRAGGRLRPRSVHLDDYNWEKPNLDLRAQSPSGVTDFTNIVHPGRYQASEAHGKALARVREERFDTEREYATGEGHCRALGAGTVFTLEHAATRFAGNYLTTQVRHRAVQRMFASGDEASEETYRLTFECIRCGADGPGESKFRPDRLTPTPRIHGTQTAIVTAEPGDDSAEINVGGPCDIGCVRVRFHWDMDSARVDNEGSSCWIRVSQFFAGSDHGALWHPRVGDEVIVEFLDGDPDRPIITGRVYNGLNPAPENATKRPTYSAIKSNTSPNNGNYNLIAFEDLQGSEEIIIHAARDWNSNGVWFSS